MTIHGSGEGFQKVLWRRYPGETRFSIVPLTTPPLSLDGKLG